MLPDKPLSVITLLFVPSEMHCPFILFDSFVFFNPFKVLNCFLFFKLILLLKAKSTLKVEMSTHVLGILKGNVHSSMKNKFNDVQVNLDIIY